MTTPPDDDALKRELNALGENLHRALLGVWESEDRKRLQSDVESGLEAVLHNLRSEVREFQDSDTGKRLKNDLKALEEDLRAGETAARVREEIVRVVRSLNQELERSNRPVTGGTSGTSTDETRHPGSG